MYLHSRVKEGFEGELERGEGEKERENEVGEKEEKMENGKRQ